MAKGSVRKKGKKWYFRFYAEDESGNRIQKEMPGTGSKSETETLLRKAMAEVLNPSKRSNSTAHSYINTANRVKQHAIGKDKSRTYYAVHCLPVTKKVSEEFNELSLVCVRHNGAFVSQKSVSDMCLTFRKKIEGIGELHFHKLRHTYSSKLIASGVPPKDVQELLGHLDLSTTMNIYTHGSRESKRNAVMLLEE